MHMACMDLPEPSLLAYVIKNENLMFWSFKTNYLLVVALAAVKTTCIANSASCVL